MTRLKALLDRQQLKASITFGGGYAGVNAFSTAYESVWSSWSNGTRESLPTDYEGYVAEAYTGNGVVFACAVARAMPFSESRFQYQRLEGGRPTDLFGGPALSLLENPWPGGTTGELLFRMEQDATIAGNCYLARRGGKLRRLRPDWVTIVSGVRGDPDADAYDLDSEVLGYIYHPRGTGKPVDPVLLSVDDVAHYSPITDPMAQWRGMSWLTPVLREIDGDTAALKHKSSFFKNGASLGVVVKYPGSVSPEEAARYKEVFDQGHAGPNRAFSSLHLGGGADVTVVGADLKSIDFKAVMGAGETRIAAAAGVGAIIARLSEGMQGSSLNAGNYQAAARQFADMTLRPLWRTAAASLAKLVDVPAGSRLWYDARDVAMLHDTATDEAAVFAQNAAAARQLIDAGFKPDDVIRAVDTGDLLLLTGKHTGLYSVQLRAPGEGDPAPSASGPAPGEAP